MDLDDGSLVSLSLTVSGYQFPDNVEDPHDSNWLNVVGVVTHPRGGWAFHDPCLLASELASLRAWFRALTLDPAAATETLHFTEPNLEFQIAENSGKRAIRVHLSHESSPPWVTAASRLEGVELDFPLAANDLQAAETSLGEQCARFPERATQ